MDKITFREEAVAMATNDDILIYLLNFLIDDMWQQLCGTVSYDTVSKRTH